jgi:hypothetical protein
MHRAGDPVQMAAAAVVSSASFGMVSLWVKQLHLHHLMRLLQLLTVEFAHVSELALHPLLPAVLPPLSMLSRIVLPSEAGPFVRFVLSLSPPGIGPGPPGLAIHGTLEWGHHLSRLPPVPNRHACSVRRHMQMHAACSSRHADCGLW